MDSDFNWASPRRSRHPHHCSQHRPPHCHAPPPGPRRPPTSAPQFACSRSAEPAPERHTSLNQGAIGHTYRRRLKWINSSRRQAMRPNGCSAHTLHFIFSCPISKQAVQGPFIAWADSTGARTPHRAGSPAGWSALHAQTNGPLTRPVTRQITTTL
jgi:hypothetical protein